MSDMQVFPGLKFLYLRKVLKRASESMADLRRKVLKHVPHTYSNSTIVLPNGSRMLLGGYVNENQIDSYLGLEYDAIVLEDATTLTASKFLTIDLALRTSRQDFRPRMYLSANPGGVGHQWFKKLLVDPWVRHEETRTRFIHATMGDNVLLDKAYETKLNALVGWERRAYRDGDFSISAGQFFDNFNPQVHVRDFKAEPHWTYTLALDYGYTHPTVVLLLAEDGDGDAYVIDEHAQRRWQVAQHVDAIHSMLHRYNLTIANVRKCPAGHDIWAKTQDGGKTLWDLYQSLGIIWYRAKVDRINGAALILARLGTEHIVPRLYFHTRCHRLIEQMPLLEHDPYRPEDVLKVSADDETGEGGDDFYDALRYGVMEISAHKVETKRVTTQSGEREWLERLHA
jgi:phage terminase large subunit